MNDTIHLRAPAKLNLGLRVVGRRDDGYHLLDSVFAPIAIEGELEHRWVPGAPHVDFEIEVPADAELPAALGDVAAGPDNLVVRAAERFLAGTGLDRHIEITPGVAGGRPRISRGSRAAAQGTRRVSTTASLTWVWASEITAAVRWRTHSPLLPRSTS